jgi:hypothetical protein
MRGYNWHSNWINKYESLWSIIEKFKYANSITSKEFYNLFLVYSHKKGEKPLNTSLGNNDLLIEFLTSVLLYPLREQQEEIVNRLLSERNKLDSILNENLRYCSICIQDRYHSVLHQLKYLYFCPYHKNKPLVQLCHSCNKSIPFKLKNDDIEAFNCICRETVYGFNSEVLFSLEYHNPIQKALVQSEWFFIDNLTKYRVYFKSQQKDVYLEFLNQCSFRINTKKVVLNQKNQELKIEHKYYKAIYSSIARNIRKRMNKKQLRELSLTKKNLISSEDPLVQTYLLWRLKLEGRENLSSIDNGMPRGKNLTEYHRYFSTQIYDNIFELNSMIENHTKVSNKSKQYILSKCFVLHLMNLYCHVSLKVVNNQKFSPFENIQNPFQIGEVETRKDSEIITLYYQLTS